MLIATKKDVWHPEKRTINIITELAKFSNSLFNVGTYQSRQEYFENQKSVSYAKLCSLGKENENSKLLYSQVVQQTLKTVAEAFISFRELEKIK
ncbi:hypothetical protein [uncultured Nostoc sp.]|uniref:hypothetical protein n=1 Tax=uncultured Nostoc sp. TaxID=340711 RepID=UPI0035CBBB8F